MEKPTICYCDYQNHRPYIVLKRRKALWLVMVFDTTTKQRTYAFLFYRKWIFSMNDVHMTFCTYLPIPSDPFNLSVYSVISFLKCQIACCSKCTSKKHDLITGCMRVTLYIGWRTYLAGFHCHPLPLIETVST